MGWKVGLLVLVVAVAGGAWAGVGLTIWLGLGREIGIFFVMAAAIATEAVIWALALVLGVSVYESRRKIWRALTRQPRAETD